MLPSFTGLVSGHDLATIFSDSTDWVTIHQMPESVSEPEYVDKAPWVQMSFQIRPGEPVQTEMEACKETGLVKRIKLRRRPQTILQTGR